jgi:hypothetical protein
VIQSAVPFAAPALASGTPPPEIRVPTALLASSPANNLLHLPLYMPVLPFRKSILQFLLKYPTNCALTRTIGREWLAVPVWRLFHYTNGMHLPGYARDSPFARSLVLRGLRGAGVGLAPRLRSHLLSFRITVTTRWSAAGIGTVDDVGHLPACSAVCWFHT